MRHSRTISVVSAVAVFAVMNSSSNADFSYDFSSVTGSAAPGTLLNNDTVIGSVGQDNWVLASGVSSYVRNDPPTGFSGNFAAGGPADAVAGPLDSITTRAGANLGIGGNRYATFQFDGLVGFSHNNTAGNPVYRRSELAPGIDANLDGDVRGTSLSSENAEVGFQFGYEATGSGWYLRKTSYSNTGTVTAATTASGIYTMQVVVDFNANPSTVVDTVRGGFINDGSGTLYVKQIADAAGNAVNDVFRVASAGTSNFNLGLSLMGGFGGADPANWNGMSMRTANNGGLDNILFRAGLPTTSSSWAADAGSWLSSGNWYIGVPNAIDAVAELTGGARVNSTVYADSAVTVGTLVLNNSNSYNISGAGLLTLETSTGSAAVNVQAGSHKINLPLVIASNTTFNVSSGATLKISDPMTINAGKSVTQSGAGTVLYESSVTVANAASLAIGNSTYMNRLALQGTGSAVLTAHGAGTVKTLALDGHSIASGGKLDLTDNRMEAKSTAATIRAEIKSGAIMSSLSNASKTLGYADRGGGTIDVAFTLKGDTDLSFAVDFDDLLALAQNYGTATSGTWETGDFDYNDAVNFDDLLALAQVYGTSMLADGSMMTSEVDFAADWALAMSIVPEPTSLTLVCAPLILARRRRV